MPSINLSTNTHTSHHLLFTFNFNETNDIKHKILIPKPFHDTLGSRSWQILIENNSSGSTIYQDTNMTAEFMSSASGNTLDYTLTETIDNVTYYVLQHKTGASGVKVDATTYKLRCS